MDEPANDPLYTITFMASRSLIERMDEHVQNLPMVTAPSGRSRRVTRSDWLRGLITREVQE